MKNKSFSRFAAATRHGLMIAFAVICSVAIANAGEKPFSNSIKLLDRILNRA